MHFAIPDLSLIEEIFTFLRQSKINNPISSLQQITADIASKLPIKLIEGGSHPKGWVFPRTTGYAII